MLKATGLPGPKKFGLNEFLKRPNSQNVKKAKFCLKISQNITKKF